MTSINDLALATLDLLAANTDSQLDDCCDELCEMLLAYDPAAMTIPLARALLNAARASDPTESYHAAPHSRYPTRQL